MLCLLPRWIPAFAGMTRLRSTAEDSGRLAGLERRHQRDRALFIDAAALSCSCTLVLSACAIGGVQFHQHLARLHAVAVFDQHALDDARSNGCSVLVRSLTTMRPGATATMSTWPKVAQAIATTNSAQITKAVLRGAGCAGVSCRLRAAGRKASSSVRRFGPASSRRTAHAARKIAP